MTLFAHALPRRLLFFAFPFVAHATAFAPARAQGSVVEADARRGALQVRPFVLFVHGRNQMGRPDSLIVNEWIGALKVGLGRAGDSTLFGPRDVGFVMYQHVFEEDTKRLDAKCTTQNEVGTGIAEQALVDDAFRSAVIKEQPPRSPGNVTLDFLRSGTNRLPSDWIQKVGLKRAKDTDLYLKFGSPEYCSVQHALLKGIALASGRPLIIVAHSMGGLVSYRMFVRADGITPPTGTRVARLVTLGTQIGHEPFAQALSGRPHDPYPYPSVERWVNVHDVADPIGWPTYNATRVLFESGGALKEPPANAANHDYAEAKKLLPVDVPIHIDLAYHHSISGYLSHPIVIRAIASGWCDAILPRPSTCDRYHFQDVGPGSGPPGVPAWNEVAKRTTRFGVFGGTGALLGASAGLARDDRAHRKQPTLLMSAGGAIIGGFLSLALDRWAPNM